MKNLLLLSAIVLLFGASSPPLDYRVVFTSVDHMKSPVGVDLETFFFSWKLASYRRNVKQRAYQVVIAEDPSFAKKCQVWNSGKIREEQSIVVPYAGPQLQAGRTYYWRVRSWPNKGRKSEWSVTNHFTTGLFAEADWQGAKWIAYDSMPPENRLVPGIHHPGKAYRGKDMGFHTLPIFRKTFKANKPVKQALLFVTGLGHYELSINGNKIGQSVMAPGWTHYDEEALYNTYDCTTEIETGKNAIAMMLGNGFLVVPNSRYRKVMTAYANPMLRCRLKLIYADGSEENIISDKDWKVTPGPITYSSIYSGEHYDARLEPEAWRLASFNDKNWAHPIEVPPVCDKLIAERDYPIAVKEVLAHRGIYPNGEQPNSWTYDFGQNASAMFRITVQGKRGDTVRIAPGELIFDSYAVNQKATGRTHDYIYVLKGDGPETWQPRFTYYGFRYLQVDGAVPNGKVNPEGLPIVLDIKMLHTRNAMPETGQFQTTQTLFNQTNDLIKWAIKSNAQSVLTDCPHREKLGWLEQTYLMGASVHYNFDVYGLYNKLVQDMKTAQTTDGLVPAIVPEYVRFGGDFTDSPEWGSAAVILPWLIYKWYGDASVLEEAWPMMEGYVAYLESKSDQHIISHGLGDWYDLGPERPGYAQLTPKALTATAIYFYDVKILTQVAALLGKMDAKQQYTQQMQAVKTAFNQAFFDPNTKVYSTGSQTAISMPLVLGLVEEKDREAVVQTLLASIHDSDYALTAGDVGFHFLIKALQDADQAETIYKMNARDDVPGYGYQLKKGATALTESWQALEVVSNNHLMLGHLMEWFYSGLAGINQTDTSVAYKTLRIQPQILDSIDHTYASFETPYGRVSSSWRKVDRALILEVEVPVNTTAKVVLPSTDVDHIYEGDTQLSASSSRYAVEEKEGHTTVFVGSGKYRFRIRQ